MVIKKEELIEALQTVKPGVSKNLLVEQMQCFIFDNGSVITYNDEISIIHPIDGLDFNGAVNATEFLNLISKIKSEELDITVVENELLIKAGKAKAGFVLQAEINLPLYQIKGDEEWQGLPDNFISLLEKVYPSCGSDMSKPALMSVFINHTTMCASDSFKIIRGTFSTEFTSTFLLPQTAAKEVVSIQPTQYLIDDNWVLFKNENGTIIVCRISFERAPDFNRYFNQITEGASDIRMPSSIDEIIEKAGVIVKSSDKINETIYVYLEKNKIKVRSQTITSWFEETARCNYDGENMEFGLAPVLFKDIFTETKVCKLKFPYLYFKNENWEYLALVKQTIQVKETEE